MVCWILAEGYRGRLLLLARRRTQFSVVCDIFWSQSCFCVQGSTGVQSLFFQRPATQAGWQSFGSVVGCMPIHIRASCLLIHVMLRASAT
jgi:hypothetical protein